MIISVISPILIIKYFFINIIIIIRHICFFIILQRMNIPK